MTDKVVEIKKSRRKKPLPPLPDLTQVKNLSMARMSHEHMALILGLPLDDFTLLLRESHDFQQAVEKGRAEAIYMCASVVLSAAQGKLGVKKDKEGREYVEFGPREQEQLKSAKEYLKRHAPEWLED